jgi:hypothetical protein
MGDHSRSRAEVLNVRHDAERLRRAARKIDDELAVACLTARAQELEALAAILEARTRPRRSRFGPAHGRAKGLRRGGV